MTNSWTILVDSLPTNREIDEGALEKLVDRHTTIDLSSGKVHAVTQTSDYIRFKVGNEDVFVKKRSKGGIHL